MNYYTSHQIELHLLNDYLMTDKIMNVTNRKYKVSDQVTRQITLECILIS